MERLYFCTTYMGFLHVTSTKKKYCNILLSFLRSTTRSLPIRCLVRLLLFCRLGTVASILCSHFRHQKEGRGSKEYLAPLRLPPRRCDTYAEVGDITIWEPAVSQMAPSPNHNPRTTQEVMQCCALVFGIFLHVYVLLLFAMGAPSLFRVLAAFWHARLLSLAETQDFLICTPEITIQGTFIVLVNCKSVMQ